MKWSEATLYRSAAPFRYAAAAGIFAFALALRLAILPVESRAAFVTFYPATAFAFYLCGPGPGRMVVALCALSGFYIFTPPDWSLVPNRAGALSLFGFVFSSLLIGWVVQRLQSTTERMNAAIAEARTGERRFHAMLEDQTEFISRFKADSTVLYVNDAFCRMFGIARESVVGYSWKPNVVAEDLPRVLDSLATLTPRNPVVVIENRVFAAGGEIRWGQFVNRALFDDEGRLVEIQSVGRDITQRKQLEAQLAESARAVQDLYDNAPCGYYSLDPEGRFLRINAVALLWLGCTRAEAIGKLGPADFFTAEGRATFRSHFPKFKETGRLSGLEFDLVGRDGRTRRVSVSATAVFDERGEFVMSRSVMYDISELHAVRTELRRVTREQAAMLDNELVGMVKVRDRHIVWRNRAVERMFGYAPGELLGQPSRVLYFDDATHEAIGQAAYPTLRSGGRYRSQVRMARKGGDPIWIDVSGVLLSQETGESMWLMVDITLLRQHLEHVEHIAFHDLLTGLPNRALLDDRIGQAIHLCDRMGRMVAVCYLDLDGFKDVNDEFGHEAGDRLLKEVARRLQAGVRASDTVVRVGGDEFVLVLAPIEDHDECIGALHRVLTAVSAPIALDAHVSVQVTASIGGALYPRDAHAPDALVALADEAMYEAKRAGRNRVVCVGSKATEYVHAPDAAPAA